MNKLKCVYIIVAILFAKLNVTAQLNKFAVQNISSNLLLKASVVKREESILFEVKSINKATCNVHKVVTVINEAAKDELVFYEFTDKFRSLGDVTIEVFDAAGNSKKKYYKSDLTKQAAENGLVPDGKIYFITIPTISYPITLKLDYEIKYNGLLSYPMYEIQSSAESVEKSSFAAIVPTNLDLRFAAKNTNLLPTITQTENTKTYQWKVENKEALAFEEGSVSRESRYPQIIIAPNKFELDGYEGDMTSWKNFGNWYASLAKDALNLSEESKANINNLIKNVKTEKEKIKILYSYLQNNFRYVSIQLGIGGFKPFEANFVDKKKYGDCKALSNYMQACLAAVGIKSYQALINAGYNQESVNENFTVNKFNHVILCVPQTKDSIWLECTSTTSDFGELGNFTENRNALLITEDGGKLVATPKSKATTNTFTNTTTVQLNDDGSGHAQCNINVGGEYKQDFIHYVSTQKKDDQKKYLIEQIGYLDSYNFDIETPNNTVTKLSLDIEKLYDFSVGKKLFIHPRIYKIWSAILPTANNRTKDFYFEHPFLKTDTTIYLLTNGLSVEFLPKNKTINFDYGSFKTTYFYNEKERKITTTTQLILEQYKIPAIKFATTKQFFDEVINEYSDKIVLKKL